MSRIIDKCTDFSPKDRYQNAKALKRVLINYKNRGIRKAAFITITVILSSLMIAAVFYLIRDTDSFKSNAAESLENEIYIFNDPFVEQAARVMLGKPEDDPVFSGDLKDITSLYFAGKTVASDADTLFDYAMYSYDEHGTLNDLSDLEYMENLQELYLALQPIEDLSPLSSCDMLRNVFIISCPNLRDLSPLSHCQRLQSLTIQNSVVTDLSTLATSASLRELSLGMMNRVDLSGLQDIDSLQRLYIGFTSLRSLSELGNPAQIEELTLHNTSLSSLNGIENFSSLTALNLANSNTVTDFSALDNLPNLKRVYINPNMEINFRSTITRDDLSVYRINDW